MNWFYEKDSQPAGPVDDDEFARLIADGTVTPKTLVWRSGFADWKPHGEVAAAAAATPPPVPAGPALENDFLESPAPASLPSVAAGRKENLPYAGFWIRVAALLFDNLILLPVLTVIYLGFLVAVPEFLAGDAAGAHVRMLFVFVILAVFSAYQTLFVGRFGATPGKMICNLRVISPEGGPISYSRALGRYFCQSFSGLFFGAGFVIVALNRQKCALHDLLCDTRVIQTD